MFIKIESIYIPDRQLTVSVASEPGLYLSFLQHAPLGIFRDDNDDFVVGHKSAEEVHVVACFQTLAAAEAFTDVLIACAKQDIAIFDPGDYNRDTREYTSSELLGELHIIRAANYAFLQNAGRIVEPVICKNKHDFQD